ncbi:MAG: peptidylprolyl isomerase [Pseudomonadota bacterium]
MFELALDTEEKPREVGVIVGEAPDSHWREIASEQLLIIETEEGDITVALSSVLAQDHIKQLRTLARENYYEGLSFYRVIEGFVAQGGDHQGTQDKGSEKSSLAAEFEEPLPEGATLTPFGYADHYAPEAGYMESIPAGRDPGTNTAWLAHCTGALAFGREVARDTASTEFYITLQPQRYLDRNLTVAGRVIDGMGIAQAAPRGVIDNDPETDDFPDRLMIKGMTFVADMPEDDRPRWRVLDDQSPSFRELINARAARPSDFFYYRPNHVNLCQMPIPVERITD